MKEKKGRKVEMKSGSGAKRKKEEEWKRLENGQTQSVGKCRREYQTTSPAAELRVVEGVDGKTKKGGGNSNTPWEPESLSLLNTNYGSPTIADRGGLQE